MFDKITYGVRLYLRHFGTIAIVGLPIYIPTNVFRVYLMTALDGEIGFEKLIQAYDLALAVFETGVVIAILNRAVSGKPVRFFDVIATGVKRYLPLAATMLLTVIICGLGLLACVIPGIICFVRYALVESVVVVEKLSVTAALRRSWQLTNDCAWWILLVYCVFHSFIFVFAQVPTYASSYVTLSHESWLFVAVIHECTIDLMTPLLSAIMFSFYLHASGMETPMDAPDFDEELLERELDALDEDDNPYRAPQTT